MKKQHLQQFITFVTGRNFLTRNWFFHELYFYFIPIYLSYFSYPYQFLCDKLRAVLSCNIEKFYASVRAHYLHWRLNEKVQLQGIIWIYTQFVIYVLNLEKVCIGRQINKLYPIYTRSDLYRLIFFLLWVLLLWYIGLKMKIISKKKKNTLISGRL